MRVPLSWLREYVAVEQSVEELAETLTFGGFEVEGILRPTAGVRGVVVGEVRAVAPVAGSDKLHLVEVHDGQQTREIVCGVANYEPGDRVPAALPGAELPGGLRIERREMRGTVSDGMLASPRELGVGDDHEGIWVLDADAPIGAALDEWLDLDDPVLELDITPDRAYGMGVIGLARDVAALTGAPLREPDAVAAEEIGAPPGVPVEIEDPAGCLRFDARRIEGVQVGRAPAWLQRRLVAAGMRPISNVVDATNHTVLETGHPVHAYDLALLAGPRIAVRRAREGEAVVTLDGVERQLHTEDLVIADADGPVGLAGVMGGERTEVSPRTTALLLEVASFDPAAVARTARRHRLRTEASMRFERTVPAGTVPLGASRCAELICAVAGGEVTGGSDTYPSPVERERIHLQPARARSWLGMDLADARQQALLEAIGCAVAPAGTEDGALRVTVPHYRPDLRRPADLYEEIARLHGYGKVPERLPSTGQVGGRRAEDTARRVVRRALAGSGWSEALVFPFIDDDDLAALGFAAQDRRRRPVPLVNPLSKEESVLRTSLLPGLLRAVRHNVNRQTIDLALFEVGAVYLPPTDEEPGADGGPSGVVLPAEPLLLGLAACGAFEPARHERAARAADLYDLLGAVESACAALGRARPTVTAAEEAPFHPGRTARVAIEGVDLGVLGELHPRVIEAFELPPRTLAGELRLDRLVAGGVRPAAPAEPSPLPGLRFDVAVLVDEAVPAADVEAAVRAGAGPQLTACALFDVYRGEQLGEGRKSLAFTVRLDEAARQLTDEDEAAAIDGIARAVGERVGGHLRR